MTKRSSTNLEILESYKNASLSDAFDKCAHRSWLKASLDNWIIDEKNYLNEIKKLSLDERSISDFVWQKKIEYDFLKKNMINSEIIYKTVKIIAELFEGKTSKLNWDPASYHPIGVAWILSKYEASEQDVIVWLLHDVIEDIEDWEKKLREKWYSEEIINHVKELTENKALSRKERKAQYLEHLKEASNDIKTISAADKLYNVRSFLDDYLIEQDNMRNKFNAGKQEQMELLENYMKALKNKFQHPITNELEEVIKRLLSMIK